MDLAYDSPEAQVFSDGLAAIPIALRHALFRIVSVLDPTETASSISVRTFRPPNVGLRDFLFLVRTRISPVLDDPAALSLFNIFRSKMCCASTYVTLPQQVSSKPSFQWPHGAVALLQPTS